jgi:PPOX class probable F420-dependent enzyme
MYSDGAPAVDELERAKYISLTTFKRDGFPVSSPVWITGTGGTYLFTTGGKAWKTRRLQRNATVQVQVCDMRGRIKPTATVYMGTGEVLTSSDAVSEAERALATKYGWQFRATKIFNGLKERFERGDRQEVVAVQLSLVESNGEI